MSIVREQHVIEALKAAKLNLKNSIELRFFNDIIDTMQFFRLSSTTIYLLAKNSYAKSILESEYKPQFHDFLNQKLDSSFEIKFIVESEKTQINKEIKADSKKKTNVTEVSQNSHLDSLLNFDSLVVGDFNKKVYDACNHLLDTSKWKTFTIVGDVGSGKTHFLHAFGNKFLKKNPTKKVRFVTSTDFIRDFYNAFSLSTSEAETLKSEYMQADLILIDDLQGLSKRTKINEILLSMLTQTRNPNQKFVFSVDRYVNACTDINNKIISRLRAGLCLKITEPTTSDFKKVLKHLIKNYDAACSFSEESLEYIVNRCNRDLRTLEGISQRLMFFIMNSSSQKKIISIDDIKESISKEIFDNADSQFEVDPEVIINKICSTYGVDPILVKSRTQSKIPSHVRHVCCYVLREKLKTPFSIIGELLGERTHSTIMESCTKIKKQLNKDKMLKEYLKQIYDRI